ncbi:MAG: flagellar basal body L-ring protein FlgH [Myxococcota bacterium]
MNVSSFGWLLILVCTSCGVSHIDSYVPKTRRYQPPTNVTPTTNGEDEGSLFTESGAMASSVSDVRALNVNDVVTVRIVEVAHAERMASTDVDRDGAMDASLSIGGGARPLLNEGVSGRLGLSSSNSGRTARQDNVRFTVAATVKQRLSNGNLFVEGHRVVMVNDEEHHYYISGVARPADIDAANSIRSDRLADAQIELTGRGIVSDAQEPGWLARFIKWISPF